MDYYNFRSLREAGLVKTRPTSTTSSYKQHSRVENPKRSIQFNNDPSTYDIVTPLCNDTKKIISFTTKKKFISPLQVITINKDQGRKEGLAISKVFTSDEPYCMCNHRNILLSSDEGSNKAYNIDNTKKISLFVPKDKFVCLAQVIMTIRGQEINRT